MKKLIFFLIFMLLPIPNSFGTSIQINPIIKNINLNLLLKLDGSMHVTQEFFQTYQDLGFDNGSIIFDFVIGTTDFTNLKVYDLRQPSNKEYVMVDDVKELISRTKCDNQYSIKGETVSICAPMKKDRSLHFEIDYLLYPKIDCIEEEKRRHEFNYGTKTQKEPYTITVKMEAEEGMTYLAPINCPNLPMPWKKTKIERGIICKIENAIITDDLREGLFFVLAGNLTGERLDMINKNNLGKQKIKDIIRDSLMFVNFALILLGIRYGEIIKQLFNRNTKNKIIIIFLVLIIFVFYLLFLFW